MIQTLQEKKDKVKARIAEQKKTVDEGSKQTVEFYTLIEQIELYVVEFKKNSSKIQGPISTDSLEIKKQLKTVELVQDEYISKKPMLERLQSLTEKITSDDRMNFTVKSEITTKFEFVSKSMDEVWMRIEVR